MLADTMMIDVDDVDVVDDDDDDDDDLCCRL
jgi:hypothetical protein